MISIIIPVYNEALNITRLLTHLTQQAQNPKSIEIIVIDGGSIDNTVAMVHAFAKACKTTSIYQYNSPKGRGRQLHYGSQHAHGSVFYFLHADSYPPNNYDQYIIEAIKSGHPAGCFRMRFDSTHWWLRFIGWFTRFSWRACRGGDQSQYITSDLYNQIGGYNTQLPIYEDYDIIHRLYQINTYHIIPQWLTTSARRYHKIGVFKLQYLYLTIYWKKYKGASITEIYNYYSQWFDSKSN